MAVAVEVQAGSFDDPARKLIEASIGTE